MGKDAAQKPERFTPWTPTSSGTRAGNLICLCRRHHRIKQRPGWQVRLNPDATVTWTSPTGTRHTTTPVDRLHGITLPAPEPTVVTSSAFASATTDHRVAAGADRAQDVIPAAGALQSRSGCREPADRFSVLEYQLEHHIADTEADNACRNRRRRRDHGPSQHNPSQYDPSACRSSEYDSSEYDFPVDEFRSTPLRYRLPDHASHPGAAAADDEPPF